MIQFVKYRMIDQSEMTFSCIDVTCYSWYDNCSVHTESVEWFDPRTRARAVCPPFPLFEPFNQEISSSQKGWSWKLASKKA